MPPKRVVVSNPSARPQKSFLGTVYDEATSPENTTIVRSILVFVCKIISPLSSPSGHFERFPSTLWKHIGVGPGKHDA
ncbi:TOM core complex subunit Tom6 [Penicillium alfredii]|uniref:TOM core complex subunit Tom6 n=1 Tax=Penicillium alfredii TaxID=1506179 RepID=A0A9W9F9Z2_9EURO|nr:TOM core complex subunit Tom6 [Penicillium alfredii]KAJ5096336.1 TOM core complex subunit Tom6 [Penicillium alfredii]